MSAPELDRPATPRILAGPDALERIGAILPPAPGAVLIIADAGMLDTGLIDRLEQALPAGREVTRFVCPPGEPTLETVNAAAGEARRRPGAVTVGLGGGSALDCAKLVASLSATALPAEDLTLGRHVPPPRGPSVMIPTTSGTGSEVTHTAIVSDAAGHKLWAWAPDMAPDAVILDPDLSMSVPPAMIIGTGLDAFVHGLEAVTGQGRDAFTELYGLAAIRHARSALAPYRRDPRDRHAAGHMQLAATLAGLAINTGGTGIAHTIGHALGSLYHVPHGIAVALGLQASLEWSIAADPARYATVAPAFGVPDDEPRALAGAFDEWLDALDFPTAARPALPSTLDTGALAREMANPANQPMRRNNARPATEADLDRLAERVTACWSACLGPEARPA